MDYTPQEIYEALNMLKEICNNSDCSTCVLRSEQDGCGVEKSPCHYDLNRPNTWIAFRK